MVDMALSDDQKALHTALARVKELCKGNGVKPDQIAIIQQSLGIHSLKAKTTVTLKSSLQERVAHGKTAGGVKVASRDEALKLIEQSISGAALTPALKAQIAGVLLGRPDKGFALSQQTIALDTLKKDYTYHHSCAACGGAARVSCPKCQGRRVEVCIRCNGRGMMSCHMCHSTGLIQGATCTTCQGHRQIRCTQCQGSGQMACRTCQSSGISVCHECHGQGVKHHSIGVTVTGHTAFEYEAKSIPHGAASAIDNDGPALAKTTKIKIDGYPIEDDQNTLGVSYNVTFPYADVVFQVGGKTFTAGIFGYDADLVNFPPILDKLLLPGIGYLEDAAQNRGDIVAMVKQACQYRAIRLALSILLKTSPKKAAALLVKKFSPALSPGTSQKILFLLVKALSHLTMKPRLYGCAGGMGLSATIMGAVYLTPARGMMGSILPPSPLDIVLDLGIWGLCGFIILACIQWISGRAVTKIFGLGGADKASSRAVPQLPGNTRWGFAGASILMLLFLGLRMMAGLPMPIWAQSLLTLISG